MEGINKYIFSVVIPVYNCAEYLKECVDSVLSQTIGKDKIQIILVNDGSTDNSDKIGKDYADTYKNILYIEQENQGVSVARNTGMEYAEGEIITFLDSDDKWDEKAFEQVYQYTLDYPNINLFSCKVQFFEARTSGHYLNYKYKKDKIVNIFRDIKYPQLFSNSVFFRSEVIKKFKFPKNVRYGEDVRLIAEFLMDYHEFMVLKDPIYYYRRRYSEDSAIQTAARSQEGFFERYEEVYKYIFNKSKEKFGYVLPYFQYIVLGDLQWYIRDTTCEVMEGVYGDFTSKYKELLNDIDDNVILSINKMSIFRRIYCLTLKYGKYRGITLDHRGNIYLGEHCTYNINLNRIVTIQTINIHDKVEICGKVEYPFDKSYFKVFYAVNDEIKELPVVESDTNAAYGFMGPEYYHDIFTIEVPTHAEVEFFIKLEGYNDTILKLMPYYDSLSHLCQNKHLKYVKNGLMIYNMKYKLCIKKYHITPRRTIKLCKELSRKALITRLIYRILSLFVRKDIWLISDRRDVAGDNGEAFFEYVTKVNDKSIKPYFVLDKSSKDWNRLNKIGKVIEAGSFKHMMLYLLASKNISSQADEFAINPLKNKKIYRDISKSDFVFLQHGITKDDLSAWLTKRNKNIRLFITSAIPEYNSIKKYNYYYDKEVVLTGMPRFDKLENKPEKLIAIMPTWRHNLEGRLIDGIRQYSYTLKNSEYYNFYHNLINDKKLKEYSEKNNYKIIFVLHPSHAPNLEDFNSDFVEVITNINYRDIFSKAELIITDYSSVAFDFAYLRKPVIYAQFDKEEFFETHTYTKGYFSYEEDGFGPVVYNYEDTINTIINQDYTDKKYEDRINKFFEFNDKNNSKRVYDKIKKM